MERKTIAIKPLHTFALFILTFPLTAAAQERSALTFDEAAKLLLLNNPRASVAARSMDAARSRVTYNKAGLGPQVSANAAYNRLGTEPDPSTESYSYGFSASQSLFSPALWSAVRSAGAAYRKAKPITLCSGQICSWSLKQFSPTL